MRLALFLFALLLPTSVALADNPKEVEIRDWFAFGSGCRSKKEQPGSESMTFLGAKKDEANSYTVQFSLPKYTLDGTKPVRVSPTFARQCAMRMAAFIPKDRRIASIKAHAPIVFSKEAPVRLEVAGQLLMGQDVVAQKLSNHPAGKAATDESLKLELAAGKVDPGFPEQTCGSAKVLGFDLSFTNWRDTAAPKVHAAVAAPGTVEITFTLEPCTPPTPATPTPATPPQSLKK
jgi:hypothetical protein